MSTIKGGGDFPKNQPISGKQGKTLETKDTASPFQITDGLVLSGSGLSEKTDEAQTNTDPTHLWRRDPDLVNQPLAKGLSDAQGQMGKPLDVIGFDTCLMAEVDGRVNLTGPRSRQGHRQRPCERIRFRSWGQRIYLHQRHSQSPVDRTQRTGSG